jgi:pyruvate,water dikinase
MTGHNIVSAGVPTAIKRLAQSISNTEMFKQMKPEEALEWILNTEEESGKLYKKFIEDHGHRGYKEADVMSNTWKDTPLLLIQIIQTMLPIKEKQNEETLTSDDICANIKTPLSRKNRILLKKWIIPSCHKSICEREEGKSFVIRIIDKLRQFIREMAKMMSYKEGRIPEPDLIFYLKIHELIKLTKFRDPKIVAKAKQRKRVFPKLDKFFYDEIIIGPQMKPTNVS